MSKKPVKMFVLVGLPASGKSTVRDVLAKHLSKLGLAYTIVSPDDIRGELCNGDVTDQSRNKQVFELAHDRLNKNLKGGRSVIFDATCVDLKTRRQLIRIADRSKAGKVAVWMDTSLRVCKQRNSKRDRVVPDFVFDKMKRKYKEPTIDEGFDSIIRVGKKTVLTNVI
jgi:predicted kinase